MILTMNIRDYSTSCFYALCVVIAAMIFIPNVSCFPYSYEIPDNFMTEDYTNTDTQKRSGDGQNKELCPRQMSKLQCIHSYLELYAKMQSGMTDPMSLRNIGKRSKGYDKKGALVCPPNMDKIECYDNAISYYIRLMRMMASQRK